MLGYTVFQESSELVSGPGKWRKCWEENWCLFLLLICLSVFEMVEHVAMFHLYLQTGKLFWYGSQVSAFILECLCLSSLNSVVLKSVLDKTDVFQVLLVAYSPSVCIFSCTSWHDGFIVTPYWKFLWVVLGAAVFSFLFWEQCVVLECLFFQRISNISYSCWIQ